MFGFVHFVVSIFILLFHSYIFSCLALTVDEELRRIVLTTKKLLLQLSRQYNSTQPSCSVASCFDFKRVTFYPKNAKLGAAPLESAKLY